MGCGSCREVRGPGDSGLSPGTPAAGVRTSCSAGLSASHSNPAKPAGNLSGWVQGLRDLGPPIEGQVASDKVHRGFASPGLLPGQSPLQICPGTTPWDSPQLFCKLRIDSGICQSSLNTSNVLDTGRGRGHSGGPWGSATRSDGTSSLIWEPGLEECSVLKALSAGQGMGSSEGQRQWAGVGQMEKVAQRRGLRRRVQSG